MLTRCVPVNEGFPQLPLLASLFQNAFALSKISHGSYHCCSKISVLLCYYEIHLREGSECSPPPALRATIESAFTDIRLMLCTQFHSFWMRPPSHPTLPNAPIGFPTQTSCRDICRLGWNLALLSYLSLLLIEAVVFANLT